MNGDLRATMSDTVIELGEAPSTAALYRRAVLGALPLARSRRGEALPGRGLALRGVRVDRARLAAYNRVCGFGLTDVLPPTYHHVLAFPLSMALMSAEDFPFPVIGLVHVANRVEILRPVRADEPLDLAVRAVDLRPHGRGRQFDVIATASVGDEPVWRGVSTYLRREAGGDAGPVAPGRLDPEPEGGSGEPEQVEPEPARVGPHDPAMAVWTVPARVGTAYADASGDRNPIHTSTLGARLFGFRRPIAHGMWTMARCLAVLAPRLPDAYSVDVAFKRPVLLPATLAFRAAPRWSFTVRDARSARPHLSGTVTPTAVSPTAASPTAPAPAPG